MYPYPLTSLPEIPVEKTSKWEKAKQLYENEGATVEVLKLLVYAIAMHGDARVDFINIVNDLKPEYKNVQSLRILLSKCRDEYGEKLVVGFPVITTFLTNTDFCIEESDLVSMLEIREHVNQKLYLDLIDRTVDLTHNIYLKYINKRIN